MSTQIQDTLDDARYLRGIPLAGTVVLLALANFMAILDTTIVNVSVPHIAGTLAISPNEGTWVITSYAVAEAITVPLSGWLAARFGSVRVFVTAVGLFGVASTFCGFARTLPVLLVFRVLQGFAGGPLMPMSQTLLMRVTPPRHVQIAIGLMMTTTVFAPIIGPVLGGTITDSVGWPWAFYINVPVSAFAAVMVWQLLASRETGTVKQPVDYVGLGLLVVWIGALQIMLDNGEDRDWFGSPFIVTLAILCVVAFAAFLMWELTDEHPIVDLSVFRYRTFSLLVLALGLTFGSYFATIVLIPLWLQTNMGYTATMAGEIMGFQGMLGVVMSPIAAIAIARIDARIVMSTGLSILAAVTFWRAGFTSNMTFWQIALPQLFVGLAIPMFFVPLLGLSVAAVPSRQTASAAGLVHFLRTMSGALGAALITTAWDRATTDARVNLVGELHRPDSMLNVLHARGLSPAQALHTFGNLVQGQAVMIATDRMFVVITVIVLTVALSVWLTPKPKGAASFTAAEH
jgi:MFS transporter, DHA2 family, multidrug resistance protein